MTAPTVSMTVGGQHPSLIQNHWSQVSHWLTYSDADGDPAVQYQFQDNGTDPSSAYLWTPAAGQEPASTTFTVNASDLNSVWFKGGAVAGQEFMQVRAFDGTAWGTWTTFQVDTFSDSAPALSEHLRAKYGNAANGTIVPITIVRDGKQSSLAGPLHFTWRVNAHIAPLPGASAKAIRVRSGILHGTTG